MPPLNATRTVPSIQQKSKYLSRNSLIFDELEEVRALNKELQKKHVGESAEENISRILGGSSNSETSPEYYSVFLNEHYISDIDENEEIKEFLCGYKVPERRYQTLYLTTLTTNLLYKMFFTRYSDQYKEVNKFNQPPTGSSTLPSNYKGKKCSKKSSKHSPTQKKHILKKQLCEFAVSGTAGDYYAFVPSQVTASNAKKVEFSGDSTGKVIKSPYRTVVKLAKIR